MQCHRKDAWAVLGHVRKVFCEVQIISHEHKHSICANKGFCLEERMPRPALLSLFNIGNMQPPISLPNLFPDHFPLIPNHQYNFRAKARNLLKVVFEKGCLSKGYQWLWPCERERIRPC